MAAWRATFEFVLTRGFPADYRERLDRLTPRIRAWSPSLEWWGAEDGNRVDVWSTGGAPAEGLARFDLRAPDPAFVAGVLAFAAGAGIGLRDESERVVAPTAGEFALALRGSRAFRFVEDPARYLTRLLAGGLADA